MKKPTKNWEYNSIYSAFKNYCWSFKNKDPLNGEIINGDTFYNSAEALSILSLGLRKSIEISDQEECKNYCLNKKRTSKCGSLS